MTPPRKRKSNMNHTVSLTDGELAQVRTWAAERGKSVSAWFCECALSVEPFPEKATSRPLVLDAEEQHGLARAMAAARDMHYGGQASSTLADAMRALLEMRLRAMACDGRRGQAVELLRRVLGDERAAIVAAAVLPETEETSESAPDRPTEAASNESPGRAEPRQTNLFAGDSSGQAGGA